ESEDLELLEKHLAHLQTRRQALLERRSQCVCEEVRTRLSTEQDARESWRDSMEDDNTKLKLLIRVLILSVPLHRFVELFDSAQYEEAAQQAAHCPRGLLRNLHTLNMFKAVTAPPDSPPPLLLFFLSLVTTTPVGQRLPESVSYEGVRCALDVKPCKLLCHVHCFPHRLTSSERLGDVLTEHAQKNPSVYLSDMLLALASENYRVSGAHRKLCLSMCRRGLTHSAVELMRRSEDLTSGQSICPSLCLLKLLTRPEGGGAMLSVGVVCVALLSDSQSLYKLLFKCCALSGVLEAAILQDSFSTVEEWSEIAAVCSTVQRSDLAHTIRSVLLSQSGTGVLSSDPEGALLTQHIYM
uniref:Uncharacterized protein n=1 Tax=Periophthalmus magnuspinnatus TaxID=409849 RepID=A0A3B4APF9_9GOBI